MCLNGSFSKIVCNISSTSKHGFIFVVNTGLTLVTVVCQAHPETIYVNETMTLDDNNKECDVRDMKRHTRDDATTANIFAANTAVKCVEKEDKIKL